MKTLSQLVFGPNRPDQMLMTIGSLPDGWPTQYEHALQVELSDSSCNSWQRSFAQAAHWASMYLPIRLNAAAQLGHPNIDTLKELRRLSSVTERALFADIGRSFLRSVEDALSGGAVCEEPDWQLVYLSLGQGNPVNFVDRGGTLDQWRQSFVAAWDFIGANLRRDDVWPKWSFMAARFASFYWDLWFTQNIQLKDNPSPRADILSRMPVPVQAMFEVIVEQAGSKLNNSGLPVLGAASDNARYSVRRLVEAVLADTRLGPVTPESPEARRGHEDQAF